MVAKSNAWQLWVLTVLTVRRLLWRCRMMRGIVGMSFDASVGGLAPCHTLQLPSLKLVRV